ncbi:hypothetical protein [Paraburkholderia humisilvae]|uniref:hypothetical protein n=1 Tax=Paraburkholderia humisilvae TaxID=627669 RepID=UPI00158328AB|nr:hypothetical protein [Paraburkholderia humisilvae]
MIDRADDQRLYLRDNERSGDYHVMASEGRAPWHRDLRRKMNHEIANRIKYRAARRYPQAGLVCAFHSGDLGIGYAELVVAVLELRIRNVVGELPVR